MTQKQALHTMIGMLVLIILFHIAIITQIIPYSIVWGGRLKTLEEMFQFETVSIGLNVFLIIIMALKGGYLKLKIPEKILNGILWIFLAIFTLNTIGNLFANTLFEKVVFTPITALFVYLIWKIIGVKK